MYTVDDATFGILSSCSDTLASSRLTCYMYLLQLAGLNYQFRYQMVSTGVKSRGVDSCLNCLINEDKIKVDDGILSLTDLGTECYEAIMLTYEEWEKINKVKSCLDSLTDSELTFVVLTDIVVSDTLEKYGVDGLISQRKSIQKTLMNLSREYTDSNFNDAIKVIRFIKEDYNND